MPPVPPGKSFTIRGIAVGLAIGTIICAANVYFGLQTGWVSIMSMPASLMGYAAFKALTPILRFPFSPVENVLVQSVACGMAIMPLGCGFVGVIPAMTDLLVPSEHGPLSFSIWQLIVWSLGLCYFGVVFAVPLRRQVIIRERLRFPSGFSTAILISVLHSDGRVSTKEELDAASRGEFGSLIPRDSRHHHHNLAVEALSPPIDQESLSADDSKHEWASNIRLLLWCFSLSGLFTICTYFFPILRNLPIFGTRAAHIWLWTLNPSPAYVGQGIIMGVETTLHMVIGAIIGWGFLSPLAKSRGWAPGKVDDWEHGSKGWIIWVSLAIMLVDAVISLSLVAYQNLPGSAIDTVQRWISKAKAVFKRSSHSYAPLLTTSTDDEEEEEEEEHHRNLPPLPPGQLSIADDAPPDQLIGHKTVMIGLLSAIAFCLLTTHIVFGDLVPVYTTLIAVLMALVLSIMGVRALGETDLNPVSGISKLAQLFFALIIPQSNSSSILINLIAGAISEAGALQAGDLMQDLKTGHLLGAAPQAQFWGQVIGATAGAVVSALIYRLYTIVYEIPGDLFQVPTAYVWIFTARLVTGQGLPAMAKEWAIGGGVLFACTTIARTTLSGNPYRPWIPGGIAVAIGMYNVPSFTLARAIGGVLSWVWTSRLRWGSTPLIILASGFILGEGFLSIGNLVLEGLKVPHFT